MSLFNFLAEYLFNLNIDWSLVLIIILFLVIFISTWFYTSVGALEDRLRRTFMNIILIFILLIIIIELIPKYIDYSFILIGLIVLFKSIKKTYKIESKKEYLSQRSYFAFIFTIKIDKQRNKIISKYKISIFGLKLKIILIRRYLLIYLLNFIVLILAALNKINLTILITILILNLYLSFILWKKYIKYYSIISLSLIYILVSVGIHNQIYLVLIITTLINLIGIDWVDSVRVNEERKKQLETYFSQN